MKTSKKDMVLRTRNYKKNQYFSVILYNTDEYPVLNIYVEVRKVYSWGDFIDYPTRFFEFLKHCGR